MEVAADTSAMLESKLDNEKASPKEMTSSVGSALDSPSCPTDSGVESSELNESMISSGGFEFDANNPTTSVGATTTVAMPETAVVTVLPDLIPTSVDLDNSNANSERIPDEMVSSTCSTFDADGGTEIVYRRRVKKTSAKAPKKRVSFHEDILKNTKTDNIHIEHGFITYKGSGGRKPTTVAPGRYSWCSELGDHQTGDGGEDDEMEAEGTTTVYRNACSDMLDYGQTNVFESEEERKRALRFDNSGVFEYQAIGPQAGEVKGELYKCECSSSNSSLDDENSNERRNYPAAKSNSCDCIQDSRRNNNLIISDACYYSEPSIEDAYNQNMAPKSVWSKEKKPKSSCLKKKTKYQGGDIVIPEYDLKTKVKKFNVHHLKKDVGQIIDNGKFIFGSLKDIFGIVLPERGVPEGCEDLQAVVECVPETPEDTFTVINKPKNFLSKSLDQGLTKKPASPKNYVHNVDEQLRHKNEEDLYAPTRKNSLKDDEDEPEVTEEEKPAAYRNKYIINCESTVFEHTGVSYVENSPTEGGEKAASFKDKITNMITKTFGSNASSPTEEKPETPLEPQPAANLMESSISSLSDKTSIVSDATTSTKDTSQAEPRPTVASRRASSVASPRSGARHLASPSHHQKLTTVARMTPDLFNFGGRATLSEDFDDILTITTSDTDKTDDIVIVDMPTSEKPVEYSSMQFLRPPSTSSSKTSLINRFLRNVTQKKIMEATIKKNAFFQTKLNAERKLFGNLYVKGAKNCPRAMVEDMNAEIAMEIDSASNSPTRQRRLSAAQEALQQFEGGVGEISIDLFNGNPLYVLRPGETLMKAFKLYTGYSCEGFMTPVLVLLSDHAVYVVDSVRNRLCNKFVLPYAELDVILMGPFGNTVLLSNGSRDMQQVLLAGGPYPADGIVASLELCARRGGATLPAIGQLTLDHLAPLQAFVRENSSVSKNDAWKYYAVVNVPARMLGDEKEPLGPHLKGPLMHRSISHSGAAQSWSAGYFLLKAGVLYLFTDPSQKLPSWAVALRECQGARRSVKATRPHTFELLLRTGCLQLAAPDEYVASEWLQGLVQAASGLFEMQERHKTLGCSLVMTDNHLITLREDFSAPLRKVTPSSSACSFLSPSKENVDPNRGFDTASEISSTRSTPTRRSSSAVSTPSRAPSAVIRSASCEERSSSNMSSFYGKNSGVEILTCAALEEMIAVKVPVEASQLWCILEFSCQEVRENSDDLVIFFSTASEQQRFLSMLKKLWLAKTSNKFPMEILSTESQLIDHCSRIFSDINKSWDNLLSAALGYPQ